MRVPFKTSYNHDIRLFADGYQASRYAALVALAVGLPFVLDDFLIGEVTGVLIWSIRRLIAHPELANEPVNEPEATAEGGDDEPM